MSMGRFWLYDIEFDNNPQLELGSVQKWNNFIYCIMMLYTVVYVIVWQKDNKFTNSTVIVNWTIVGVMSWVCLLSIILVIRFYIYNKQHQHNMILPEQPKKKQDDEFLIEDYKFKVSTFVWTFILLITIGSHFMILLVMIIRFPLQGTHWIIYGINMFNMITGHIFTFILGTNIIYNLLVDKSFYMECVKYGKLQTIMIRVYAQTGYFTQLLMVVSVIWGSLYSAFIIKDTLSIFVVCIFGISTTAYLINDFYQKNIS